MQSKADEFSRERKTLIGPCILFSTIICFTALTFSRVSFSCVVVSISNCHLRRKASWQKLANNTFLWILAIKQIYKLLPIFKVTKRVAPEELRQRGKGGGSNIVTYHSVTLPSFPICLMHGLVDSELVRVRDSRC